MQVAQTVGYDGRPAVESGGDQRPGLGVHLGELAAERSERAAPLRLPARHQRDHHVPPGAEPFEAAEVSLSLVAQDGVGLAVDDRLDELVLVGEVVVELRSADLRRRPHVIERGAGDAPLVDQLGGSVHDPRPGTRPLGGELQPVPRLGAHEADPNTLWV